MSAEKKSFVCIGWVVRMRPNFRTNESPIYFLGNVYNGKEGKKENNNDENLLIDFV